MQKAPLEIWSLAAGRGRGRSAWFCRYKQGGGAATRRAIDAESSHSSSYSSSELRYLSVLVAFVVFRCCLCEVSRQISCTKASRAIRSKHFRLVHVDVMLRNA